MLFQGCGTGMILLIGLMLVVSSNAGSGFPKKLGSGLKKIGVTEDQVEALKHLAKGACSKMYLSFMHGSKERKKAKKLLTKYMPMIKIERMRQDGNKCLKLKMRDVDNGEPSSDVGVAPPTGVTGAESGQEHSKDVGADETTGPQPQGVPGDADDRAKKHIKYMRALAKKLRSTEEIQKKLDSGENIQVEQKLKLDRLPELKKEIQRGIDKAKFFAVQLPEQLLQDLNLPPNPVEPHPTNVQIMAEAHKKVEKTQKKSELPLSIVSKDDPRIPIEYQIVPEDLIPIEWD